MRPSSLVLVLPLSFSLLCAACGDPQGADGDADTGSETGSEDTATETESETDTGGDYCLDTFDLEPNFEITGQAPSGTLNWGGTCNLGSVNFDEAVGVLELLFGCEEAGQPFNLGIAISDLDAQPSSLVAGADLDLFVFREVVINIETDPEQWFAIKSGDDTLAAGHIRAHGPWNAGPVEIEAMTDCEIVDGEELPQGYLAARTDEGEARIEVGEVGTVSLAGVSWDVYAREAIPSCCLGYESTATMLRQ